MKNIGPIKSADVHFGDLTIIVGPQATGKSIFLQALKLAADNGSIQAEFARFNIDWQKKPEVYLDLYFGEGMAGIWNSKTSEFSVNGKAHPLTSYAKPVSRASKDESIFFIPAQRIVSLRNGQTQTFGEFRYGDPFTIRAFSEQVHQLVQNEFGRDPELFPRKNRLSSTLREPISKHIFGGGKLAIESKEYSKRVMLQVKDSSLPFLAWSAGQREFTPLLLGLYWLCPPAASSQRDQLKWAVIEEPEMGLHPQAISTTMALIGELLARNYKICISTHSPHVLDVVWALQFFQKNGGAAKDVRDLLGLAPSRASSSIADAALSKNLKVYYFQRNGQVHDISGLDPGADDLAEAGWGGLSEFSGKVGDIVARVARRNEEKKNNK